MFKNKMAVLIGVLVISGVVLAELTTDKISQKNDILSVPFTLAAASVSPTKTPSVLVRLGPGKYGKPLWLEVVKGEYKLTSGATFLAGSALGVSKDWMTFPSGLAIDVKGGDITLKGTTYSHGTKLLVNDKGELTPR